MDELLKKLEELKTQYDVNKHDIITSPGKFEGELLIVPYLYTLEGDATDEILEDDESEWLARHGVTAATFTIEEDEYGFVYATFDE